MVEFGAGGNIIQPTQAEVPIPAPDGSETVADGAVPANGIGAAAAIPNSPTNARRKRKAKGWFCPVCRQRKPSCVIHFSDAERPCFIAYSSLLRMTTSPPLPILEGDKEASPSTEAEGSSSHGYSGETRGGLFGTSLLRGLSFTRNHATDVENQASTARVGA